MNENKIKKLEALKENVTQFSDMWIIEMCDKTIAKLKLKDEKRKSTLDKYELPQMW